MNVRTKTATTFLLPTPRNQNEKRLDLQGSQKPREGTTGRIEICCSPGAQADKLISERHDAKANEAG